MKYVFLLTVLLSLPAFSAEPLYKMDFEKADLDKAPENMIVLDGAFTVKSDGKNKFLELPGAPLETFGVLYGPAQTENVGATARFLGTGKGRRFPAFALGVSGAGGYKLQVSPAKRALEIFKGDQSLISTNYQWKSGAWTHLKVELKKHSDNEYIVRGKAWAEGDAEPKEWQITYKDTEKPPGGPSSVWGNPFSGEPIRFDDFVVTRLE